MFDLDYLQFLMEQLAKATHNQDIDQILFLCEENDQFIFSLEASTDSDELNDAIKQFAVIHHSAIELIQQHHQEMKDEAFKTIQNRKNLSKYEGIKYAK